MRLLRRLWTGRTAPEAEAAPPPRRPPGPLIWTHCPDPARLASVAAVAAALRADGDSLTFLVTCDANQEVSGLLIIPPPEDTDEAATAFQAHWTPDILLWIGDTLTPSLLNTTGAIPRILVDVTEAIGAEISRWQPRVMRSLIEPFDQVLSVNEPARARLVQLGVAPAKITVTGPFAPPVHVLPSREYLQRQTAETLGPRPLWLAHDPTPAELDDIAIAHRLASQRSHRLLMILATDDPDKAQSALEAQRFNVVNGLSDQMPTDETQVFLVPLHDIGLWFRLAPLCFLGGTLAGTGPTIDPLQAAAVGSVLLHGPRLGLHSEALQSLASVSASRTVRNGNTLGTQLEELLAPDKAALMAHAAWDLTSQGAETENRVTAFIRNALDRMEI